MKLICKKHVPAITRWLKQEIFEYTIGEILAEYPCILCGRKLGGSNDVAREEIMAVSDECADVISLIVSTKLSGNHEFPKIARDLIDIDYSSE